MFNLPSPKEIAAHIENSRTYDSEELVPTDLRGYGTHTWLEPGVRSNVLQEMTGRVALSKEAYKVWHRLFDAAYMQYL